MLAGFLPDQPDTIEYQQSKNGEYSTSSETFPLEEIIKMQVTFEGKKLKNRIK